MRKTRFTEQQIVSALQRHKAGVSVQTICREYGISRSALYQWLSKYHDMTVSDVSRLIALEQENARLKMLVADLSLQQRALQELLEKKS